MAHSLVGLSGELLMIVVVTLPPQPNSGVGLFEANAIQFGLDQLLEAPTLSGIS